MAKQVSAEQKDKIIKEAYGRLQTYGGEGRAVAEYSVDVARWLEKQPKVYKATLRGRNTITVEFDDGSQVGILLDRLTHYGGRDDLPFRLPIGPPMEDVVPAPLPALPWWWQTQTPGTRKALLFDPLYDDWPPEATTDDIETLLDGAGYTVDKMLGGDGDLAHLETIESAHYGVIFIRSHGGILVVDGDDKIHIMTRPYLDNYPDPADSGYDGIGVFYVETDWGGKYAYAFNEQFVRHHLAAASFPDTLMHLLVCHGGDPAGADDLIDAFRDFGVSCYTGWTRNASSVHGDPAAVAFFEYLCGAVGRTVAGAINHVESLGHSPDALTAAELVAYGSTRLCLRGLRRIVIKPPIEDLKVIQKFPKEPIEIVLDLNAVAGLEDWSIRGGKISPVDEMGQRRFIHNSDWVRVLGVEDVMEEAVEAFVP